MARIQDPLAERRPTPRASGGIARLGAQGPSEAPGQAVMQLGEDIGAAGDMIYRAQKIEEDRINTLRAEDAFTKLRQRQLELTVADGGFARLQGEAAVTKSIRPEYLQRFDDAQTGIARELTNDEQRTRFQLRAKAARLQYDEEILRHLAQQGDVYAKQVYDGAIGQATQDASVRWDSPVDVAGSLERIRSHVFDRAERYNWAPEYRDSVLKEEAGKVHTAVIGQAIAKGNYKYAQFWYDQNKDHVTPQTQRALATAVEDGTQKEMTAGFNSRFLAERENRRGLEALAKEVVGSSLDETRKNIVHGRILNRIDALDLKAERERLQRERTVSKLIGDANANTLAGMPATVEQLTPIYEAAQGTELEAEARQMVNLANSTASFASMTPIQQAGAITQAEAQVRSDPTKFDRRVLDAWKSIHGEQQKMLEKDPITFASRQGIAEPTALDLTQPTGAAPALAERYAISRSMQAKYGSPNRPLTEPEAQLVSRALADASWKERRDYLGGLFQASNGDVRGYSGIMSQIAPDHPVTALAGEYQAKGRGQASELMLAGEDILRPGKKADGKPDGAGLMPLPPETDMRAEFDSSVRDAYAGRPELRNTMYQATRAIYAKLASDSGVKDTKVLDGDLWEKATQLATGGVAPYNGRSIPMPYGMDRGEFRSQVRLRTEDMAAAGALPEGITPEQLQDLPLEPVGDGRYVFRAGTGVLVSMPKHDRPILRNPDGSISTERTTTIEADGRYYNIPTIVGGKQLTEDQAVKAWRDGKNEAVGEFESLQEAERGARARTEALGRALQPRPILLDFNQSAAFRTSGYGEDAPPPAGARTKPFFSGPDETGIWR